MPKVIFQKSGVEAEWTGDDDNLLEFGEGKGVELDFSCRMGNCTACQQPILAGEVSYPDGHSGEPEAGNQLLCCSVPKGDRDLIIGA